MVKKYLNPTEYAKEIGVCRSTVIGWVQSKRIPFVCVGNVIRIVSGTQRPEKRSPWHNARKERDLVSE
jgi:excisionase family DNA binding protein